MISGKAEHITDTQRISTHEVRLQSNAVAVAGYHLHDRLKAHLYQMSAGCDTGHTDDSCLVIGHINGINIALEFSGLLADNFNIRAAGRTDLRSDGKLAPA